MLSVWLFLFICCLIRWIFPVCYFSWCVLVVALYYYYECVCYGWTVSEEGSGGGRVSAVKQLCKGVSRCVHSVKCQYCQRMLFRCFFVAATAIKYNGKKKLEDVFSKVHLRFIWATKMGNKNYYFYFLFEFLSSLLKS